MANKTVNNRSARKAPAKPKSAKADSTATTRQDLALSIFAFNGEATNVVNMLTMSKGDNYVAYSQLVGSTEYPALRAALEADLAPLAQDGKINGFSLKAKAHSLAVSIKKTVVSRNLKFNKVNANGKKYFEGEVFAKYDSKAKKDITKSRKVTETSVFKPYDVDKALAFLAKFK